MLLTQKALSVEPKTRIEKYVSHGVNFLARSFLYKCTELFKGNNIIRKFIDSSVFFSIKLPFLTLYIDLDLYISRKLLSFFAMKIDNGVIVNLSHSPHTDVHHILQFTTSDMCAYVRARVYA